MTRKKLLTAGLGLLLLGLLVWGGPTPVASAHGADDAVPGGQYWCPMMGSMMGHGPGMMGPMMGYGPGMGMMGMGMSGYSPGMPMPGMMGGMMPMMGRMAGRMGMGAGGPANAGLTEPLPAEQAILAVKGLPAVWGNPDLAITKLLEFTNHFYVLVEEKSTGTGALELLVDRYSGLVKNSPTAAWNAQYGRNQMGRGMMGPGMMGQQQGQTPAPGMGMGMMGQMMGGQSQPQPQRQMAVSPERAKELAQQFLQQQLPGMALGEVWSLPGYYTIAVNRDGRTFTLLSVNGLTGQVWLQSWHGGFIAEQVVP